MTPSTNNPKINTEDCKRFIARVVSQNTSLCGFLGLDSQGIASAADPKEWKRLHKCSVAKSEHAESFGEGYMIFEPGCSVNRFGETRQFEPASHFTVERGFDFVKGDGQVAFLVLERPNGELALGNYIGD
jgi:hypothetical protein